MGSIRSRIAALGKPKIAPVEMPDGETLHVRELTGAERDAVMAKFKDDERFFDSKSAGWRATQVALFLCDEKGDRIFDPVDDIDDLNALSNNFLERILVAGFDLAAIGKTGVEDAKANFPATPSDGSTSESSGTSAE